MTNKKCSKCCEEKSHAHFIAINSQFFSGSLPICRECLNSIIAAGTVEQNDWNIVNKICQWADIPFLPEEWDKIKNGNRPADALGIYVAIFREKLYDTLDWTSYNDAYSELKERECLEESIPSLRADKIKKLKQKWGDIYDLEALNYLENLHVGLLKSQNVVGTLNEDQAMKICQISLIIEERIRAGDPDIAKFLKAYDDLVKIANFTPKTIRDGNEFDSAGEVYAYLEKTGWVNKYYDGVVRDEVDKTIKNFQNWVRYLYVNETGISEEIEERINNLKLASEIEGDKFDEDEFREYTKTIDAEVLEDGDFELDI